jgi:hypothetical protein
MLHGIFSVLLVCYQLIIIHLDTDMKLYMELDHKYAFKFYLNHVFKSLQLQICNITNNQPHSCIVKHIVNLFSSSASFYIYEAWL